MIWITNLKTQGRKLAPCVHVTTITYRYTMMLKMSRMTINTSVHSWCRHNFPLSYRKLSHSSEIYI